VPARNWKWRLWTFLLGKSRGKGFKTYIDLKIFGNMCFLDFNVLCSYVEEGANHV
jgi:hypothetical protein